MSSKIHSGTHRIATSTGAMLADPAGLGNLPESAGEALFDPDYWRSRGELAAVNGGRGAAWFVGVGSDQWVLRHYRRGGNVARVSRDAYLWCGESRVRAFAEWRLLALLSLRGLPVPQPIAARYRRTGFIYRCDLITRRIAGAQPLSAALAAGSIPAAVWRAIGATIARLHGAGVDHADLNAHNILLTAQGGVSVIDFDRCRLRAAGPWMQGNLKRLRRSLDKVSRELPRERFSGADWDWLLSGYRSG
jgi:3-deoxy-D-manno-octulosonic acid kinase